LLWAASCDERFFFAFLAARYRAILCSIFVLLIFIARWQINMMMNNVFYEYSVFLFFGVYFAVGLYIFRVSCQWPWRTITNKSHMV